ncbi:alpha/beta hydrolase family protein [Streptomyces rimosus]|uniref:alpha/beta hydrolase family protein n=1 Tax=Streptomyces rimosus TaxID=1927 RepID=UPI0005184B78|nr:acetylhydrolase [Streptomyces rimosus]
MIRRPRTAAALALTIALSLPLPLAATAGTALAAPSATASAAPPTTDTKAAARLQLPAPTGPYAVGRSTLPLTDHSRPDPWVPTAKARELMVDMYYPARRGTGTPAQYATTDEIRALLKQAGLEGKVEPERLSDTAVHSRTGARPAAGKYPLLVLSPGFGASRYSLTSLAEDLAGRGYVVATVDHAYESIGTTFPGGRTLTCAACEKVYGTEGGTRYATQGRAKDVAFVLDQLTGRHPAWRYAHLIDGRRIGMAGHSLGGASAASAMAGDHRIRAGLNLDGAFGDPVPADGLGSRPFLMLGTDDGVHRPGGRDKTWDLAWSRLDGWKRWLTVAGADHYSFSDAPVLGDQLGFPVTGADPSAPRPALSGERSAALTRSYVAAFFDLHLRHIPQPLLDGPGQDYPEVKFNDPTGARTALSAG